LDLTDGLNTRHICCEECSWAWWQARSLTLLYGLSVLLHWKLTQSTLLKTWITIYSLVVSMRTANHNIKMTAFCPHSAFMFFPLGDFGLCVEMNL